MKKSFFIGLSLLLSSQLFSQVEFHWEPFLHQWENTDSLELQALNGYVTWKLYLVIPEVGDPNTPEFVTYLFGDTTQDLFPIDITFSNPLDSMFSCCPFQHELAGPLASNLNPNLAVLDDYEALIYDSYITIGVENSANEGASCVSYLPGTGLDEFESCEAWGWHTTNGGVFQENTTAACPLGITDENNQVLIAQFTLPLECELVTPATLCVQYFTDGLQGPDNANTECVVIPEPDLCFNNPIFHTVDSIGNALCYGDSTGFLLADYTGGSGDLSAYLDLDLETEGDEILEEYFDSVPAGAYVLVIEDNLNSDFDGLPCSVTDSIIVLETDSLIMSLNVIQNVVCIGDSTGVIEITGNGGTSPYSTISSFGTDVFNGEQIDFLFGSLDITEDPIVFTIEDDHGCTVQDGIILGPTGEFSVSINSNNTSCFETTDGEIQVAVVTDSDEISVIWNSESGIVEGITSATGLTAGEYVVTVNDLVHCPFVSDTIFILEPEPIVVDSISVSPPGCGGECTAVASIIASGGEGSYIYAWNNDDSGTNTATGLCAGVNIVEITDINNCTHEEEFVVDEPEEIQIVINSTNVTCSGMCDGSFLVAALGIEPLEITFPEVPNTDVCEGDYPVYVVDGIGCIATDTIHIEANLVSTMESAIFTTPVSCWNEGDGTATIAVTGGNGEISYFWNDPAEQESATAIGLVEDTYTVTVLDEVGCTFTEVVVIEPNEECFFISSALTPNGDGYNDNWILGGLEYYPESLVQVFNRWGQQVFGSAGTYTGWDGTYNSSRLPAADYYYVISYDSDSEPLTGTVTIKY